METAKGQGRSQKILRHQCRAFDLCLQTENRSLGEGIPFALYTEVPWDSTTQTLQYNSLGKPPVLVFETENPIRKPLYSGV